MYFDWDPTQPVVAVMLELKEGLRQLMESSDIKSYQTSVVV